MATNITRSLLFTALTLLIYEQVVFANVARTDNNQQASSWSVSSPNKQLTVLLQQKSNGGLQYRVERTSGDRSVDVIAWSELGMELSWLGPKDPFNMVKAGFSSTISLHSKAESKIDDRYEMLSGKRKANHYFANEIRLTFKDDETAKKIRFDVHAADDGFAIRYVLPDTSPISHWISNEQTSFNLGLGGKHWGQAYDVAMMWTPAYETPYQNGIPIGTSADPSLGTGWGFPSLFEDENGLWILLHESNLTRSYHGSHLSADASGGEYKIAPPLQASAHGFGRNIAATQLPAEIPWRFMVISDNPGDILESNRVFDLALPGTVKNTNWIKPGVASWSWWSDHSSSRNEKKMLPFIDLAADMGWPYSLIDANWNLIGETSMQDLVVYANSKNVELGFWYNSGGRSNFVTEEPRNIMDQTARRQEEFAKLKKLGVRYVKVDFFHSDKQDMIARYLDILQDAADHEIMVVFHGCTIPRGWERTYPHLMSMEALRGAEAYTFPSEPNYAELALYQNTILPFTRNVVGSTDYTPVDFSEQFTPNITSNAHEAALGVLMESGIQHLSDSVESYRSVSNDYAKYLKELPVAWDETKYLSGYPGKDVVLARRAGSVWYIAGINGEKIAKQISLDLSFVTLATQATLLHDGKEQKAFASRSLVIEPEQPLTLDMAANGGFVLILK